jgi:hypothetical protein
MKHDFRAPLNAGSISPHTTQLGGTPANPNAIAFLNNFKYYLYCQAN